MKFCQGVAPMLAVRGEKIILQDRDDDFLMEDEASGTQEAAFLTLDLEDLAERLSKVDLAKRLFIEPDLLPPELRGLDENEADNQAPCQTPERRKVERVDSFGELLALYLEEERMAKAQDSVDKDGTAVTSKLKSKSDNSGFLDASETVQVSHVTKEFTKNKLEGMEFLDKREMPQVSHVHEKDKRPSSTFEAAAAEAWLTCSLDHLVKRSFSILQ